MSTYKRIDMICIVAVILTVAGTILLMGGVALGFVPVISAQSGSTYFTRNDLYADWDSASATKIVLSDEGSTIEGNGAYLYDGTVCITYAGHYVLTGELTDGSVRIDASKSDSIWILLDGVTLHCEEDAAIRVEQADHVFLTLADGTENYLSSGTQYGEDVIASGVDGTIYSRDDLTINGTGVLSVDGNYYHGIVCNDDLMITGGQLSIQAVQDGIHANDSVRIRDAKISISAKDDGITVSNEEETAYLYIESGEITITDCYEGLEAVEITIAGGTMAITSTDDGINANGSGEHSVIRITGGDLTITNPSGRDADGLDSNGSIYIEGGNILISVTDSGGNCALDYGSENGGECVISGGVVIACGGSGMAEGFDETSLQGFLMYTTSAEAGTTISLTDAEGKELLSKEIPYSFSSAVLSTPELKIGDSCTITVGDTQESITIDNSSNTSFGRGGMFGGGMRGGGDRASRPDRQAFGERPEKGEFSGETEPPEGMEFSGEKEPPEGMEFPGEKEPPEGMEFPGEMEPPEGLEVPDRKGLPDGERSPDEMGLREVSGRAFASEADHLSSTETREAFALVGISVVLLLLGLGIAIKTK